MPDLLIGGGNNGNGSIDGLLGLQILNMMGGKMQSLKPEDVEEIKEEKTK